MEIFQFSSKSLQNDFPTSKHNKIINRTTNLYFPVEKYKKIINIYHYYCLFADIKSRIYVFFILKENDEEKVENR